MSPVQRLFSEPPEPTVTRCDWCGAAATVCTVAERAVDGPPARIGLCEEHHARLVGVTSDEARSGARAEYERRRLERNSDIRRQQSAWRKRKAAHQSGGRGTATVPTHGGGWPQAPRFGPAPGGGPPCPQDSEELIASILQGERTLTPIDELDPRLEDPAQTIARLREALWPLVELAQQSGVYIDCNPSQTHSVTVVGEVPVQALFRARDLLKRER